MTTLKMPKRSIRIPKTIVETSFVIMGRVRNMYMSPLPDRESIIGNHKIRIKGLRNAAMKFYVPNTNIQIAHNTSKAFASPSLNDSANLSTVYAKSIKVNNASSTRILWSVSTMRTLATNI